MQNPYQPPPITSQTAIDLSSLGTLSLDGEPVEFSGAATVPALTAHLKSIDNAGVGAFLGVATLSVAMLFWGMLAGLLLPVAGGILFLLSLVTSTVVYRRHSFVMAYPNWQQPIHGHVTSTGVHLVREGATSDYNWDWFGGVAVSKRSVCLLPAMPEQTPLLLTESMTMSTDGWMRLQTLSNRQTLWSSAPEFRARNSVFKVLQKEPARNPFASFPADSERFNGPVFASDVGKRQRKSNAKTRSSRSRLVRRFVGAAIAIGFLGVVQIAFYAGGILVAAGSAALIMAISYWRGIPNVWWGRPRKPSDSTDRILYFSNGFFDRSSITFDYSLARTTVLWSAVSVSDRSEDYVVIRTPEIRRHTIVKREHLPSDHAWELLLSHL